jgi:hypothetical protein
MEEQLIPSVSKPKSKHAYIITNEDLVFIEQYVKENRRLILDLKKKLEDYKKQIDSINIPLLEDNIELNTDNILQESNPLGKSKVNSKKKVN